MISNNIRNTHGESKRTTQTKTKTKTKTDNSKERKTGKKLSSAKAAQAKATQVRFLNKIRGKT